MVSSQQMQLFCYGGDEAFKNTHLLFEFLAFPLPLAFCDQTLDGVSGQI